jgi:hypothetical protein
VPKTFERSCYHEAGHAVMYRLRGIRFKNVEVFENESGPFVPIRKRVLSRMREANEPLPSRHVNGIVRRVKRVRIYRPDMNYIVLAGPVAEAIRYKSSGFQTYWRNLAEIYDVEPFESLDFWIYGTRYMLRDPTVWPAVERFAQELFVERKIWFREASNIIDNTIIALRHEKRRFSWI